MNRDFGNIFIAGSGNVAHRLTHAFKQAGVDIQGVIVRNQKGRDFCRHYGLLPVDNTYDLPPSSTVILCLSDDALSLKLSEQYSEDILLCHTAGSVSLEVFGNRKRAGVFYPLQTLSATRKTDFKKIPMCIEANNDEDLQYLKHLAKVISADVREMDSQRRLKTHLAAVFVSNFVNHLYKIAADILHSDNLDFDILKPLIAETAAKVMELTPSEAQTGPALRNDTGVMEKHLSLLDDFSDYQNIYRIISKSIKEHNR